METFDRRFGHAEDADEGGILLAADDAPTPDILYYSGDEDDALSQRLVIPMTAMMRMRIAMVGFEETVSLVRAIRHGVEVLDSSPSRRLTTVSAIWAHSGFRITRKRLRSADRWSVRPWIFSGSSLR